MAIAPQGRFQQLAQSPQMTQKLTPPYGHSSLEGKSDPPPHLPASPLLVSRLQP